MSKIGQYLLSVIATTLIVSISNVLIEKKGAVGSALKLVTGLVLATVIVSPWADFHIDDLEHLYFNAESEAAHHIQEGQTAARSEISAYIIEHTQAYILDKASILGLDISAVVILTNNSRQSIDSIKITGTASPYARTRLTQLICEDLGITEERLIWSQNNG